VLLLLSPAMVMPTKRAGSLREGNPPPKSRFALVCGKSSTSADDSVLNVELAKAAIGGCVFKLELGGGALVVSSSSCINRLDFVFDVLAGGEISSICCDDDGWICC
jgi:hypothetical protein